MIAACTLFALVRRRYDAAALVLSVARVLFYRNSYPYCCGVMLGTACVLAGQAFDGLRDFAIRASGDHRAWLAPALLMPVVTQQGALHLPVFRNDVVHRIFPEPVSYLDQSDMIDSFPKVNLLMGS